MTRGDIMRIATRILLLVLLVVALGGGWLAYQRRRPEPPPSTGRPLPPDPRLTYDGPFQNVRPDIAYVGDAECRDCHLPIAQSYQGHAMAQTLMPVERMRPLPEDAAHHHPFDTLGARFQIEHNGTRVRHRRTSLGRMGDGQPVYDTTVDVHYAIGSGTHGISFLSERDGFVLETPISWYSQKKRWDLSPGFSAKSLAGRPVEGACLFCHANRTEAIPGSVNRYRQPVFNGHGIGCERCHGPGSLHVAARQQAQVLPDPDPTIVNPRHLAPRLREAVCEQCHLEGEISVERRGRALHDFRPGLALEDIVTVLVAAEETAQGADRAVNHVSQMYRSRCFQGSDGRLGCIRCHPPHARVAPEKRVEHFRAACLACHDTRGCSLPEPERRTQSAADSCIDCHMPRYSASDIPHTASTDHRIVRRKRPQAPSAGPLAGLPLPVVPFHRRPFDPGDRETGRDLAIGLMRLTDQGKLPPGQQAATVRALLRPALEHDPDDADAVEAEAAALLAQGREATARALLQELLAKEPERETALASAGLLAESLGKADEALGLWRRVVAVNPSLARYRRKLARALAQAEAWGEVATVAEDWLRLDPGSVEARAMRISVLLRKGDRPAADREFAAIEALRPENLAEFRTWYENEKRRR